MRLSRDEKVRLWQELTECLNVLGPPIKTFRGWMAAWSRRVMKAQRKAEQLAEEYRRAGSGRGGRARVRPLSSSHAWILTLVGDDSAYRTPTGFRCPTYKDEDDQQEKPASLPEQDQRDTAVEPMPSTSEDAGPRVPRASPQRERHDEAPLENVIRALRQTAEQCACQHREKMASAAQERELQGQGMTKTSKVVAEQLGYVTGSCPTRRSPKKDKQRLGQAGETRMESEKVNQKMAKRHKSDRTQDYCPGHG
ncbi:hypothetical protein HPB47_025048 [Ixodes persulcatus]|uniref:Uncharacterized protein n=1 Tax=Ixodes persulcatus TaxID=34615 RepID=A0AC60Q4H4_IXOPE|nr:hypothetical protein HPB47_025048 [Ixodes persulcatus]